MQMSKALIESKVIFDMNSQWVVPSFLTKLHQEGFKYFLWILIKTIIILFKTTPNY